MLLFNSIFYLLFRNIVYNLSIADFTEQRRLEWYSPENDVKMCVMKGKDDVSINNDYNLIFVYVASYRYLVTTKLQALAKS